MSWRRPEPVRHDDTAARLLWRRAGEGVARWLRENGKLTQQVQSLTIEELEGIAIAAVAAYQDARIAAAAHDGGKAKIADLYGS